MDSQKVNWFLCFLGIETRDEVSIWNGGTVVSGYIFSSCNDAKMWPDMIFWYDYQLCNIISDKNTMVLNLNKTKIGGCNC